MEAGMQLLLSVIIVLAVSLLGLWLFFRCSRESLKEDDLQAFSAFAELYLKHRIDIPEGELEAEQVFWCWLFRIIKASRPASSWNSLLSRNSGGFVQLHAEDLCDTMQQYQHDVWAKRGAFALNYPSFIVAQEWKQWAMTTLQEFSSPSAEVLEEIHKRLAWLNDVRHGVTEHSVAKLNRSSGWDESEISLLAVFVSRVAPTLDLIVEDVDLSMLEAKHSVLMKDCFRHMKTLIYTTVRYLESVLHEDTLRVSACIRHLNSESLKSKAADKAVSVSCLSRSSDSSPLDERLLAFVEVLKPLVLETSAEASVVADSDALKAQEYWAQQISLYNSGFRFRKAKAASKLVETEEERNFTKLFLTKKANRFGFDDKSFKEVAEALCFFYHRTLPMMGLIAQLFRYQARMGDLGGHLYVLRIMAKSHIQEFLALSLDVVKECRSQMKNLTDMILPSYEKLRREKVSTNWCNQGPLDNFRVALLANEDVSNIVNSVEYVIESLLQKATLVQVPSNKDIGKLLDAEITGYDKLWQVLLQFHDEQLSQHVFHTPRTPPRVKNTADI